MTRMEKKIVFMGSPDFAVPVLEALARSYPITGVVTQPDRPSGRGRFLSPPPVKEKALELGLPVFQPEKLRDPEVFLQLQAFHPDLIIVAAFGQILRRNVLELPPLGCVNVHASLLPRWRGAAPVQAAILSGDCQTGITIMKMDAGIDTGAILAQRAVDILPEETAGALTSRLARVGADCLVDVLPGYMDGTIKPHPQDDAAATYAGMIAKEQGLLDFSQPADVLARRVRAFHPWPSTYFSWEDMIIKVHRAHAVSGFTRPGKHILSGRKPAVGTADGCLVLDEVQPAGKKAMPGEVFLLGARNWEAPDKLAERDADS